jgi:hypothetical protein
MIPKKRGNFDPAKSAINCGCDPGINWTCERCLIEQRGSRIQKTPDGGEILVVLAPKEELQVVIEHKDAQTDIAFQGLDAIKREDDAKYRKAISEPEYRKQREALKASRPGVFPESAAGRKTYPLFTGLLMYFPDALAAVSHVSYKGNEQHNPGEPLHWAREKSTDQTDTTIRHMVDHGVGHTKDSDGGYHLAKAAWRILAELQLTIEKERGIR